MTNISQYKHDGKSNKLTNKQLNDYLGIILRNNTKEIKIKKGGWGVGGGKVKEVKFKDKKIHRIWDGQVRQLIRVPSRTCVSFQVRKIPI